MKIPQIAVIDSGKGGVYLAEQLKPLFPDIVFSCYTDESHLPYGEKTHEQLREYGTILLERALANEPQVVIIGCHTLSSLFMKDFTSRTSVPVLSVNNALASEILQLPTNASVFIMGTNNTVESGWFQKTLSSKRPDILVGFQACPGLASAIESGDERHITALLDQYLPREKYDAIALACTHYPIIRTSFEARVSCEVLDTHQEMAVQLENLIASQTLFSRE